MSILTILTLIFLVLKLTNYIDWSWWAVFAPTIVYCVLWLGAALLVIFETPEQRAERHIQALRKRMSL